MKKKEPEQDTAKVADEEEIKDLVPLKLIQGGRVGLDPRPPEKNDWLGQLPVGTLFLAGDKTSADYVSPEYFIVDKVDGCSSLRLERPQGQGKTEIWVITARFSQKYFLAYLLGDTNYYE